MSGMANWKAKIELDIKDLQKQLIDADEKIDKFANEDRKVKLDIDTKTLESAIQKLDKMLDSLGKGTGDFKHFENLSKELSSIVSEVQSLSKAFGKVDDSGTKTLLSSIQNIDKSLSELSQNILNVNKNMSNMGGNTSGAVKQVENISNAYQDAVKEAEKLADAQSKIGQKTNISSGMKDAFPNTDTKLDEAVTSAKDLDKTLKQVDIPTDSFDKVLEKLDRTKSELVDIVKITKQSVSDADGKFHDSYTLKDSRGSTEIYGVNSKTDKGQILRQNIVGYDVKKDTVDNSKELLAIEKQLQKEIETSDKANQKKFQDFQKEQANYEESVNKVNSAIQKTDEILDTLPLHDKLDGQFLDMIDSVDNLNSKLKSGEFTLSEYKNEVKSVTSEYSKMVSIQQKRDVEDYKANAKANLENAKNIKSEWDKNVKAIQDYMEAVTKLNNLRASDKGTGKKSYEIAGQIEEIEKLKKEAYDARQVLSAMVNPHSGDIDTWNKWLEIMNKFDQASLGSAESVNRLKDSLKNALNSELNSLQNSIDKYQKIITQAQIHPSDFHPSTEYNTKLAKLESASEALKNYKVSLQGVTELTKDQQATINKLTQNCEKAATEFKKLSAAEKGTTEVSVEKIIQRINKDLAENTRYSAKAKASLKALLEQLTSGDPTVNTKKILTDLIRIENAEIAAGRAGKSLWDIFKTKSTYGFIGQMQSYLSMYVGFYGMINAARKAVEINHEFDTTLTEMRKVSDETVQSLKSYQATTFDTADAVGTTAKQIQESTADYMRLGESLDEASESAKTANILLNVSEFDNIEDATKSLVSMGQAYKDLDKMTIVDKLNEVGENLLPKHTVMYGIFNMLFLGKSVKSQRWSRPRFLNIRIVTTRAMFIVI